MLRREDWHKFTDVLEVPTVSNIITAVMIEAVSTSETSVNYYYQTTRCNIPEDCPLGC
jgi:hypothetical protein